MFSGLTLKIKETADLLKNLLLPHEHQVKPTSLDNIRCKQCNKLLGKLKGTVEIKCTRCKTLNTINN